MRGQMMALTAAVSEGESQTEQRAEECWRSVEWDRQEIRWRLGQMMDDDVWRTGTGHFRMTALLDVPDP